MTKVCTQCIGIEKESMYKSIEGKERIDYARIEK